MKKILTALLSMASMTLGGCIFSGDQSEILTGEDGRIIAGRNQYDAYADGKESDSKAIQRLADAVATPTVTTTVKFDNDNKPIFTVDVSIGGSILAANLEKVQANQNNTQVPKNAVAQGIEATGTAIKDVLLTPTAVGAIVGVTAVEMAKHAKDNIQNGDIIGSQNGTKIIGDGTATAPAITGDTVFEPEPLE